jgi:tRNA(Ile2) C34 agmatinyltransferase TiaS
MAVLVVIYFYPENEALRIGGALALLEYNKTSAIIYVVIVLVTAAYNIYRKPFITPEVKNPKCNYCGAQMATTELKCMKCRKKSG